jgi:hypothetical protein
MVSTICSPTVSQRVERGQRILEDHGDAPAAHAAHGLRSQGIDAAAFEQIAAAETRPGGSSRPITALPMVDLPAPDSPTMPEDLARPPPRDQRHAPR